VYKIEFSPKAAKAYLKFSSKFRHLIDIKLKVLAEMPYGSHLNAMPLKGVKNCYRLRVGDWRIVYELVNKRMIIYVIKIAHRKEVYRS